ncbi:hypothetical protein TNCV_3069261 [Trichonephila clavipes]|nr:hypothetical protein TNCV_3069261 [Trichonephila clavipes]
MSTADIHRHVTEVYGTEAMSDSKVRKWVRKFKDGLEYDTRHVLIGRESGTLNNSVFYRERSHSRRGGLMVGAGVSIGGRTGLHII